MVSSSPILVLFTLFLCVSSSVLQSPVLPTAVVIPIEKDLPTSQYVASVLWGEARAPLKLVLDLNGPAVWFQCGPRSAAYGSRKPIETCSLKCSMAGGVRSCLRRVSGTEYSSEACSLTAENTVSGVSASAEVNEHEVAFRILGDSSLKIEQFLFSCAPNSLLNGLASRSRGVLGLGNSRISLPSQFSGAFGFFQRKFSLCLSPTKGAVFLGGNPFETTMQYTPLISKKDDSSQNGYRINLQAIKISGKKLPLHQKGFLGVAKLNTLLPYTVMETKIYRAFIKAYVNAAMSLNLTSVSPVAPFEVCFTSKRKVPIIDLILQSEMVVLRIPESNSIVHVSDEVMCLGFLDGGLNPEDPFVLGGLQLENRLLEFNLGSSMLGFSDPQSGTLPLDL